MKFTEKGVGQDKNILANDHYVAIPYDCSELSSLATSGVIPAGTIIPSNDKNAIGVLLNSVVLDENPNGTIVIHGFIVKSKLPAVPTTDQSDAVGAVTALKQITFV